MKRQLTEEREMEGRGGRKRERGEEREKREVTRGNSPGCWCFPKDVVQGEESQERTDLAKDPEKGMVHTSGSGVPSHVWEPQPPLPKARNGTIQPPSAWNRLHLSAAAIH